MRGVSSWTARVAPLLAAFLVLGAASAWAEDPPPAPIDPPGARMNPPGGLSTQARLGPPVGVSVEARMQPPGGVTEQARMSPPVGAPTSAEPSLFDAIRTWLQSRLSVPHG